MIMSETELINFQREKWFDFYDRLLVIFKKPNAIQEIGFIYSRMNSIASIINRIKLGNLREVITDE